MRYRAPTLRRHLIWVIAVLVVAVGFLVATSRSDYQDVLENLPVRTETVEINSTVTAHGAQVTILPPMFSDSEALDAYGVDDAAQQLLVIDVVLTPEQELPDVSGCIARLDATIDGVTSRHANRFSLSSVECDGTVVSRQQSRFVFVVPRGEVTEASVFMKVGLESTTWLRVELV